MASQTYDVLVSGENAPPSRVPPGTENAERVRLGERVHTTPRASVMKGVHEDGRRKTVSGERRDGVSGRGEARERRLFSVQMPTLYGVVEREGGAGWKKCKGCGGLDSRKRNRQRRSKGGSKGDMGREGERDGGDAERGTQER